MTIAKNLLIIGGTGRNVGKTTLANMLIKKFSSVSEIIGLKVSTHKKDEESFHGFHDYKADSDFIIKTENSEFPHKDTAKMIVNGASNAYYIETPKEKVIEAYQDFQRNFVIYDQPIICESRSLREYIIPGVYILLIGPKTQSTKSIDSIELSNADIIYNYNDGMQALAEIVDKINLVNNEWRVY